MKRVALIGSSGGGTATLGHTDPVSFLQTIDAQLSLLADGGARLVAALFVSLDGGRGMDGVDAQTSSARLFQLASTVPSNHHQGDDKESSSSSFKHEVIALGSLAHVNAECAKRQQTLIAQKIRNGQINALICVSCHVRIFRETLQAAAAAKNFVVTGSGGTSLAQMGSLYGIHLAGNAGGSVATTSLTKSVSYTHALAVAWGKPYKPWKAKIARDEQRPSWTSVLNSCLPAFWGVCLTKKLLMAVEFALKSDHHDDNAENLLEDSFASLAETIVALEHNTLPTVCAVIMAMSLRRKHATTSESSLAMATILASASCYDSVLTGLWAGCLVATWSDHVLYKCIFFNIPATMTSLLVGGGLGGFVALLVLPVAEIMRHVTTVLRYLLIVLIQSQPWGIGVAFVIGCLSCYGSKVGWYHSIHLPLILIEMELGNASFLGAVDELTLVLVCAGTCAAILVPTSHLPKARQSPANILLCRRGLGVNLSCGDFVEVCYPYMEASRLINVGGYLASGVACAWLVWRAKNENALEEDSRLPESMAYLPWPAAVVVAETRRRAMLEASIVAFGLAFIFTLTDGCTNMSTRQREL